MFASFASFGSRMEVLDIDNVHFSKLTKVGTRLVIPGGARTVQWLNWSTH